jgi:hypothetical protein
MHIAIVVNAILSKVPANAAGLSGSLVDASDDAMVSLKRL